jgi:hypothetical protein
MYIGDIIAATSDSTPDSLINTLEFYVWEDSAGNFINQPFYSGTNFVFPPNPMAIMKSSNGFTVLNSTSQKISLRIPPISTAVSTLARGQAKKAAPVGWSVIVVPKTTSGIALNPVYCGFVPSTTASAPSYYPAPPSLQDVGVSVCDDATGTVRGHKMAHSLSGGGCSYLLIFKNDDKEAQTIGYHLQTIGELSAQFKTLIFNPVTGESETPSAKDITVPLNGQSSSYRVLLVGSEAYISSQIQMYLSKRLSFNKVYPNPVRGVVHLCYTVPLAQIGSVGFRIFDLNGRAIWSHSIAEQSMDPGARECLWNGTASNGRRAAPGIYIVQMTGFGYKGNRISSFERKIMVLP